MSAYSFLKNIGLTNHDSQSLGDLATAKISLITVAFCSCGFHSDDTQLNNCPTCRKTLFWESVPKSKLYLREAKQRKITAKRKVLETLNNLYCKEVLSGQLLGPNFWSANRPNREDVSINALTMKQQKTLQVGKIEWDFDLNAVVIYQTCGKEKIFCIRK